VSRSRNSGRPRMLRVHLDGLHNQVQFVRFVHLARYAVILVWRDLEGSGEVVEAADPARGVISHEEHYTGAVFRPREQEQMIGAEVEHRWEQEREPEWLPPHRQRR